MSYAATFESVMNGDFGDVDELTRAAAVRDVVQVASIASSAITIQPIPFLDVALLAPVQIGMVQAIGRIHGYDLDRKAVLEVLSTFGGTLLTQNILLSAAKLIPFVGWVISIPMSYALTHAMGEVADHYFKTGRGLSAARMRQMFEELFHRRKAEAQARQKKAGGDLSERLSQLVAAFEAGLITEQEFQGKKEQILADA